MLASGQILAILVSDGMLLGEYRLESMRMSVPVVGDQPICLSGGADGADFQWGMTAGKAGHMVVHWSFAGHRSQPPSSEYVILTVDQLNLADPALDRASKTLRRKVPPVFTVAGKYLRRNWYQVRDAQACYAVSTFDSKQRVKGGTGWAVQMFLDRFEGATCPAYLFDQVRDAWFSWIDGAWIAQEPTPPIGMWAGIGARDLLPNGKAAIHRLMKYDPAN